MRHDYTVVYQTIEDGWILATVPELPGAITQGATLEEARANIKDAVELLLQSYRDDAIRQAPVGAIVENLEVDLPRHSEVKETTARKICDQLGIPRP
jgi:predicted RNase H-like HicB family nuclease